jgi:hypothetical protein
MKTRTETIGQAKFITKMAKTFISGMGSPSPNGGSKPAVPPKPKLIFNSNLAKKYELHRAPSISLLDEIYAEIEDKQAKSNLLLLSTQASANTKTWCNSSTSCSSSCSSSSAPPLPSVPPPPLMNESEQPCALALSLEQEIEIEMRQKLNASEFLLNSTKKSVDPDDSQSPIDSNENEQELDESSSSDSDFDEFDPTEECEYLEPIKMAVQAIQDNAFHSATSTPISTETMKKRSLFSAKKSGQLKLKLDKKQAKQTDSSSQNHMDKFLSSLASKTTNLLSKSQSKLNTFSLEIHNSTTASSTRLKQKTQPDVASPSGENASRKLNSLLKSSGNKITSTLRLIKARSASTSAHVTSHSLFHQPQSLNLSLTSSSGGETGASIEISEPRLISQTFDMNRQNLIEISGGVGGQSTGSSGHQIEVYSVSSGCSSTNGSSSGSSTSSENNSYQLSYAATTNIYEDDGKHLLYSRLN